MAQTYPPWQVRLWDRIKMAPGDLCWEWQGPVGNRGYGQLQVNGRHQNAHRMSWVSVHGPIPALNTYHGTCVLHRCDNRRCCNPSHLFLGTAKDNSHDRDQKGRNNSPKGSSHWKAKLTEEKVEAIRSLIGSMSMTEIGKRFGVTRSTISFIKSGKIWVKSW